MEYNSGSNRGNISSGQFEITGTIDFETNDMKFNYQLQQNSKSKFNECGDKRNEPFECTWLKHA